MSTQPTNGGGSTGGGDGRNANTTKMLKRYGPIVAIVVVIAVVAIIAGTSGSDNKDNDRCRARATPPPPARPATCRSPSRRRRSRARRSTSARTATPRPGRLKIPTVQAPQCVEPWDSTKDNGGATSPGVTADSIKVVLYVGQHDPLQQAIVNNAGASTDPKDYYENGRGLHPRVRERHRDCTAARSTSSG